MKPTFLEQQEERLFAENPELREEYEAELEKELLLGRRRQLVRKLIARRAELAMTQVELAKRIGVTRSYVSQMEGMKAPISVERLVQICAVLDYRIEFVEV